MVATLALLALSLACGWPADPEGTFEEARDGVLHVGVVGDPPWSIVEEGEGVAGVEVELVRRFAEHIGAKPVFHAGPIDELAEATVNFDLHLLVGGLTTDSPWSGRLAVTPPHFVEDIVVAGASLPDDASADLGGETVLYPHDRPQLRSHIRARGGTPEAMPASAEPGSPLPAGTDDARHALVAVPDWQMESLGLRPSGIRLLRLRHVMAVPPGENRMLLEFSRFLEGQKAEMPALLEEASA